MLVWQKFETSCVWRSSGSPRCICSARNVSCCKDEMKGMPRQTARFAIVETGYIPSHQRNATPNEVVRTETGCIPSLPPGTDLLAAGGHKTRPYDFGGILGVTTNLTGRNVLTRSRLCCFARTIMICCNVIC